MSLVHSEVEQSKLVGPCLCQGRLQNAHKEVTPWPTQSLAMCMALASEELQEITTVIYSFLVTEILHRSPCNFWESPFFMCYF